MAKIQILADKKEEVYRKVREGIAWIIPDHYFPIMVGKKEIVYADGTKDKLGTFTHIIEKFFKFDTSNDSKRFRENLEVGTRYDIDSLTELVIEAKVKFLVPDKVRMVPYKEHTTEQDRRNLFKYDNGTAITDSHRSQPKKWFPNIFGK